MEIIFTKSKNGQDNAQYNNLNFHSTYNPEQEALRFVTSITAPYNPEIILITEPALSYCLPYLKEKYPNAKIICIRYSNKFEKYNTGFDAVLNAYEHSDIESFLFNYFGEEKLFKILFLKWESSSKIFSEIDTKVWEAIKASLEKAKTVLVTREHFEKKWFINSVNFFKYINKTAVLEKINSPVLIIASGPSLKPLLKKLPEVRNKYFIICLSSAISVLNKYKIIPDLYLSTDGGYWAAQHLKSLKKIKNIPIALPSEAYCTKQLLKEQTVVPLNYNDGLSGELFEKLQFPYISAERNGTVSGTALRLAMNLTSNEIFFAGLDLHASFNLSHTDPNEIELNNCLKDTKLKSKEKRITSGAMNTYALDVYKDWFCNLDIHNHKIYRIIEKENSYNNLGKIQDISTDNFVKKSETFGLLSETEFKSSACKTDFSRIRKTVEDLFNDENSLKQLFPLDYISLTHSPEDKLLKEKIETKKNTLYKKIKGIIND